MAVQTGWPPSFLVCYFGTGGRSPLTLLAALREGFRKNGLGLRAVACPGRGGHMLCHEGRVSQPHCALSQPEVFTPAFSWASGEGSSSEDWPPSYKTAPDPRRQGSWLGKRLRVVPNPRCPLLVQQHQLWSGGKVSLPRCTHTWPLRQCWRDCCFHGELVRIPRKSKRVSSPGELKQPDRKRLL